MQATKKEKKATASGNQTATAKTLPHNAMNSLAAEIEAATTALIGNEEPRHGCVAYEHSLIIATAAYYISHKTCLTKTSMQEP